jgi:hypothetical protein
MVSGDVQDLRSIVHVCKICAAYCMCAKIAQLRSVCALSKYDRNQDGFYDLRKGNNTVFSDFWGSKNK